MLIAVCKAPGSRLFENADEWIPREWMNDFDLYPKSQPESWDFPWKLRLKDSVEMTIDTYIFTCTVQIAKTFQMRCQRDGLSLFKTSLIAYRPTLTIKPQWSWCNIMMKHKWVQHFEILQGCYPIYANVMISFSFLVISWELHLRFNFDACPVQSPFRFLHLTHQNLSAHASFCLNSLEN